MNPGLLSQSLYSKPLHYIAYQETATLPQIIFLLSRILLALSLSHITFFIFLLELFASYTLTSFLNDDLFNSRGWVTLGTSPAAGPVLAQGRGPLNARWMKEGRSDNGFDTW